jgi:predicted small metal-binding protein
MLMEVTCRCGWSARGSERDVIRDITAHAKSDHDLVMTPADVRAIWRQVDEPEPRRPASGGS